MGHIAVLNNERETLSNGRDSVVIRNSIAFIKGGATLNMDGFPHPVIRAGHVVIFDEVNKEYKPMPLNQDGDAYASLPANHRYAGVVVSSQLTRTPMVSIMYAGEVNDIASPYKVDAIRSDMATALPQLVFMHD